LGGRRSGIAWRASFGGCKHPNLVCTGDLIPGEKAFSVLTAGNAGAPPEAQAKKTDGVSFLFSGSVGKGKDKEKARGEKDIYLSLRLNK